VTASIHGEVSAIKSKSMSHKSVFFRTRRISPNNFDKHLFFHGNSVQENKAAGIKEKLLDSFKLNKSFYSDIKPNKRSNLETVIRRKRNHAGIIINEFVEPGSITLNQIDCDYNKICEKYPRRPYVSRISPSPSVNSSAGPSLMLASVKNVEEIYVSTNHVDKFLTPPLSPHIRTNTSMKYELRLQQDIMKSIEESRWKFKEVVNRLKVTGYDHLS